MNNRFLREALALAEICRGFCAPNPAVGAVVVKNGAVVGRGFHRAAGFPHAEVEALEQAGAEATGAILYCTLEPCCISGRTPPCTELLIERRIAKVIYAFRDPNPRVCGRGEFELREAGVECACEPIPEIDGFYESYSRWVTTHRPFVTAKLALSLDGKIAGPGGSRAAITGDEANASTQQGRKRADALLTTASTVLADDPQLTARTPDGPHAKPVYIVDRTAKISPGARLFSTAARLMIFHGDEAPRARLDRLRSQGAIAVPLQANSPGSGLSIDGMLKKIGEDGVHDLWVEAGGVFFRSLLAAAAADRVLLLIAPKRLGDQARSAFASSTDAVRDLEQHFHASSSSGCGDDLIVELTGPIGSTKGTG